MKRLETIPKAYFLIPALVLAYCFLCFCYIWDIRHTVTSSYAILNGHFLDFYAYNQSIPSIGGNDYEISVYLVFAIWNLPVMLAGWANPEIFPLGVMLYNKLLVCILFLLCALYVYKIGTLLFKNTELSLFAAVSFLLCPIAVFGPFIVTQYDSMYVLLMLAGIYLLLRGDKKSDSYLGVALIGFSLLFKPFALIGLVPLLLYKYKNLWRLVSYFAVVLVPTIAAKLVFPGAGGMRMVSRLFESTIVIADWKLFKISIFAVLYLVLCAGSYFLRKPTDDAQQRRVVVYLLYAAYAVFFSFVLWHPMWLLILMPFAILTTVSSPRRIELLLVEVAMMAGFAGVTLVSWGTTIAEDLLGDGVLQLLGVRRAAGQTVAEYLSYISFPYFSLFIAALVIDLILKYPMTKPLQEKLPPLSRLDWRYRLLVFCVGIFGFTLPPLINYFLAYT